LNLFLDGYEDILAYASPFNIAHGVALRTITIVLEDSNVISLLLQTLHLFGKVLDLLLNNLELVVV
jgi:hypothetical protein